MSKLEKTNEEYVVRKYPLSKEDAKKEYDRPKEKKEGMETIKPLKNDF